MCVNAAVQEGPYSGWVLAEGKFGEFGESSVFDRQTKTF